MEFIEIINKILLLQVMIGDLSIYTIFLTQKELNVKLIEPIQVMWLELCSIKLIQICILLEDMIKLL
jgi:hypothetical protein